MIGSAVNTMDIMPTTLRIIDRILGTEGTSNRLLSSLDGKDISRMLYVDASRTLKGNASRIQKENSVAHNGNGELPPTPHSFMLHYCGEELSSVRLDGRWKFHFSSGRVGIGVIGKPCTPGSPNVETHDPPLLFDLFRDPGERNPLGPEWSMHDSDGDHTYHRMLNIALTDVTEYHKDVLQGPNWPPPNQLQGVVRPWLFPCCNRSNVFRSLSSFFAFPASCSCDKDQRLTRLVTEDPTYPRN